MTDKGKIRNTFKQEYVPENPGSFLDAHKQLMANALHWALSSTPIYNLDLTQGEYKHEVLPPSEAKTPGRRMLALVVQFNSFDSQAVLDSKRDLLRAQLIASQVGVNHGDSQKT